MWLIRRGTEHVVQPDPVAGLETSVHRLGAHARGVVARKPWPDRPWCVQAGHTTKDEPVRATTPIFDIPEAQTVSVVQPHRVADDVSWKTMPKVAGSTSMHPGIVPRGELT